MIDTPVARQSRPATLSEREESTPKSAIQTPAPGCSNEREKQGKAQILATRHKQMLQAGSLVPIYEYRKIWYPRNTPARWRGFWAYLGQQTLSSARQGVYLGVFMYFKKSTYLL
jgi:hypothetical protein